MPRAIRGEHFTSGKDRRILEGNKYAKYAGSRLELRKDRANSIIERVKHPWTIAIHIHPLTAMPKLCLAI